MTIQEVYEAIGGSYEEALGRMLKEERVTKYARKFLSSTDYEDMLAAIRDENWEEAFRFSHNLKGMCLNLSFTRLGEASAALCDYFRHGAPTEDYSDSLSEVGRLFRETEDAIRALD